MPEASLRRLRMLVVFLVSLGVLGVVAGRDLLRPSEHDHFTRMAQGWLDGRLALEDVPPGYCGPKQRAARTCTHHRFDDYAVVYTLHVRDGESLRGFPCQTEACVDRRRDGVDTWWILGRGWTELPRGSVTRREETWYVSFPPGPAVVLLPFVAVFDGDTPDVLLTCIAAALIGVVLIGLLDRERGLAEGRAAIHLWATAAFVLGSPAFVLGAHGRVWFTAQIFGALFGLLYVSAAWNLRRPTLAGCALAMAVACRPINMAPTVVFFAVQWWKHGRDPKVAARFAAPLVLAAIALLWHNVARFDDPFEFGHRFLLIRWQARIQETGLLALQYVPRNLECLLWLMPRWRDAFPWVQSSIHGMALWLTSPWLLAIFAARHRFDQRLALALSVVGAALPSLLYQNSGQVQYGYRFAVDWLALLLLWVVFGGGARRRSFPLLVVIAIAVSGWGAWWFDRAPGRLFVTEPLGWPFEAELR